MGSQYDISIRIEISDPDSILYTKDVLDVLKAVETSLYKSDIEDIKWACNELKMPNIVIDASMERLRYFRNRRLKIYSAGRGSIIIEGLLIAVSLWILKNTIGESIKEAYKDSNMDRRLVDLFRSDLSRKVSSIIDNIRDEIGRKRHYILRGVRHENVDPTDIFIEIERHMYKDRELPVGTRNEEYSKNE